MLDWIIWSVLGVLSVLLGMKCLLLWNELKEIKSEYAWLDKIHIRTKHTLQELRSRYHKLYYQKTSQSPLSPFSVNIAQTYPFRIQLWAIYPDGQTRVYYFGTLSQAQLRAKALLTTGVSTIILHSKFSTSSMEEELSSLSSGQFQEGMPEVLDRLEAELSNVLTHPREEVSPQEIPSEEADSSLKSTTSSEKLDNLQ